MYSLKRSTWDCVIKLRNNRIFKALLWIKKSFKFIDFDLFWSYIFEFQKIVQNFNKMLSEGNFECQFETLNAL